MTGGYVVQCLAEEADKPIVFNKVLGYVRREIDPPDKSVEMGAKNRTVKRIQKWLNYHQFRTGIDSDFGPATAECVRGFQAANGVATSGKVTAATWKLLVKPISDALEVPDNIAWMSASEAVLAVAERHVERHPFEIGYPERGRILDAAHDPVESALGAAVHFQVDTLRSDG